MITSNISPSKIAETMYRTGGKVGASKEVCLAIEDRVFELCELEPLSFKSIRVQEALKRFERRV
jgi:hypothetical protein